MKHNLVYGEPYALLGRRYEASALECPGSAEPERIVLIDATAEDDPDSPISLEWYIDDAGRIFELIEGHGSGLWGLLGLELVATPYTVADLVSLGLDMEVWGVLNDVLSY